MKPAGHGAGRLRRRLVSVPCVVALAAFLAMTSPLWLPIAIVADLVRLRFRFPLARLLAFALQWAWIEVAGVACSFWLWMTGRSGDRDAHYVLMGWWAGLLMDALGRTLGIHPQVEGADALDGGNAVVLCRHASLGDSLLSGWALVTRSGLDVHYVLKRELLYDPCLDIVGLRVPSYFLDRGAADSSRELAGLRNMASEIGPGSVGVIFPEGTRANDAKRARALAKISEVDAARAERLSGLQRLLPPRPTGTQAMLQGAPDADVVLVWHTGFDGLDSFGGMVRSVGDGLTPCRFVARRIPRSEVPTGDALTAWLDDRWLELDRAVSDTVM